MKKNLLKTSSKIGRFWEPNWTKSQFSFWKAIWGFSFSTYSIVSSLLCKFITCFLNSLKLNSPFFQLSYKYSTSTSTKMAKAIGDVQKESVNITRVLENSIMSFSGPKMRSFKIIIGPYDLYEKINVVNFDSLQLYCNNN